MAQAMIKEAVGIFDNKEDLDEAIIELESTAFRRDVISVLGNKKAIEEHFGGDVPEPKEIMDDPDIPRATPIYPEEKGIGTGAVVSTGILAGTVGALVTAGAAITVPAAVTAAVIGGGSGAVVTKLITEVYFYGCKPQVPIAKRQPAQFLKSTAHEMFTCTKLLNYNYTSQVDISGIDCP